MSNTSQLRNGYLFVILSQPSPPSTKHILRHYSYIHIKGAVRQARLSSIASARFGMTLHLTLPHNHHVLLKLMTMDLFLTCPPADHATARNARKHLLHCKVGLTRFHPTSCDKSDKMCYIPKFSNNFPTKKLYKKTPWHKVG